MRYLPDQRISSDFWQGVRPKIVTRLKSLAVLESLNENQALMCPDQLKRLSLELLDGESHPLLPSDGNIKFLSLRYLPQDYDRLKWLGSTDVTSGNVLELLAHDLQLSSSRWRSFVADRDWQRRLSIVLLKICRESPQLKLRLQKMDLVPLQGGEWIAPRNQRIIMPSGQAPIPTDLDFKLVDSESMVVPARNSLMTELGVQNVNSTEVIQAIYQRHHLYRPCATVEACAAHFTYLFWNRPRTPVRLPEHMQLPTHESKLSRLSQILYFENSEDRFGPARMLKPTSNLATGSAPGYPACFLHACFLSGMPEEAQAHGRTWKVWLAEAAMVLNKVRLTTTAISTSTSSSGFTVDIAPEFRYIMQHRPEMLVLLLKHHKVTYTPIPEAIVSDFRATKVPTQDGEMTALNRSILPTTTLRKIARDLQIPTLPFLSLDGDIADESLEDWAFLTQLEVEMHESLQFYISCLERLVHAQKSDHTSTESAFKVYDAIQSRFTIEERPQLRWVHL